MTRRKTAILLALCLGVTTAFTACGGSSGSSSQPAADQAKEDEQAADTAAADAAADKAADQTAADQTASQAADQTAADKTADQAAADKAADQAAAPAGGAGQTAGIQSYPDKYHVELEEVGRASGKKNYRVTYDSLLRNEGDHVAFCDFNGNPVDDRSLMNMEYLGWGLYSVTVQIDGEVNSTGLVNAESGEVLIPFNAAIIEFPRSHTTTERPRYVLVLTGTEQTENQNEALFFATDRQFAIMAQDGDVFYKGTLKIFDLETKQFVNGLEYPQGTDSDFAQVGDNILVDLGDKAVIYSPDGKEVYTEKGSLYYNYKYMSDRIETTNVIMDANGSEVSKTEAILNVLDYNSEYFQQYNNGKYTVINAAGTPVLNGEWDYIYGENQGRFRVKNNGDTAYTLVAPDGSVVASGPNMFEGDPLGYLAFGENKNYTVVTPGSRVIEGIESDSDNLVYTKDDEASYLVLNTGEFAAAGGDLDDVAKGVIAIENSDGKKSLVDAFTGAELLGPDYDEIDDLNDDYFYLEDGDDIVIYKPVIVPES